MSTYVTERVHGPHKGPTPYPLDVMIDLFTWTVIVPFELINKGDIYLVV